jgi:HK97 family phage major capsid protein
MSAATRVPALTAARTIPTGLSPTRYRYLPTWQKAFRTADSDHEVGSYLRAVAAGDKQQQRALIAKGVMGTDVDEFPAGTPFDGTAGQLVSLPLSNYVNASLYAFGKMRQLARIFTHPSGSIRVPFQRNDTSADSTPTWVLEGDAIPADDEPTMNQGTTLWLKKLANLSIVTNELLEDAFGLADWLTMDVGRAMAQAEDISMYGIGPKADVNDVEPTSLEQSRTGSSNTPWYVETAIQAAGTSGNTPTDIDYRHLVDMFNALPEEQRQGAVWTGSDYILRVLQRITAPIDTGVGAPALVTQMHPSGSIADITNSQPTVSVLGIPFIQMPGLVADPPTGQHQNRLYLINMRNTYGILDSGQVQVSTSGNAGNSFANYTTAFRFIDRVDGRPIVDSARTDSEDKPTYVFTSNIVDAGDSTAAPT